MQAGCAFVCGSENSNATMSFGSELMMKDDKEN